MKKTMQNAYIEITTEEEIINLDQNECVIYQIEHIEGDKYIVESGVPLSEEMVNW